MGKGKRQQRQVYDRAGRLGQTSHPKGNDVMMYDYFAFINPELLEDGSYGETPLVSGFVDYCSVLAASDPKSATDSYQQFAKEFPPALLEGLGMDSHPLQMLSKWFILEMKFKLLTPWYSKDDRTFHVLDNPVRKDRVFGVPFMAAASWKGLLRWSCRMEAGLLEHLEGNNGKMDRWQDPAWIVHLFGNERGEDEEFSRGALQFYPTWFNQIGFEVINPHNRAKRAGTHPIYYEVVPVGAEGKVRLLYAPVSGQEKLTEETLSRLISAVEKLLAVYGFSAKRTAGWGLAEITKCWAAHKEKHPVEGTLMEVKSAVVQWLNPTEVSG
jgi:CRISPR-associated protein Cmr2